MFAFIRESADGAARTGKLITAHGEAETPAFMPVGTYGAVKGVAPADLAATGSQIILANAYHLSLRPGAETIAALGGLHKFMGWDGPILTDSGGYQVMSLTALRKIDDDGVSFRSHLDGAALRLTPETSIAAQRQIGADIIMALDECIAWPASREQAETAMKRSADWAARARSAFGSSQKQALFGIVQGGTYADLRRASAADIAALDFDGYALGGLGVGEGAELMADMIELALPHLPDERPRYLMGIGKPADLLIAIGQGVDMFDCVIPTREARHGRAYTDDGIINLRNSVFADDPSLLAGRPKAWLHHLLRAGDPLAASFLSRHNISWFQQFMANARNAIREHRFAAFARAAKERLLH